MLRFMMILVSFYVLLLSWSVNVGAQTPPPITFQRIVMTWPTSFCLLTPSCKPGANIPFDFTMHGIWPAYSNGTSAKGSDCSSSFTFKSPDLDELIREDLEFCWPSFTMPNEDFWKAEWDNHGICSGMSPVDYLSIGVANCFAIYPKLYNAFNEASITPGPTAHYTPMEYYTAIVKEFSHRPQIRCKEDENTGNKYLYEVSFCTDMNFNLQDCDRNGFLPGCGPYGDKFVTPIYFPT